MVVMAKAVNIFFFLLFSLAFSLGQIARIQFAKDIAISFLDIFVGIISLWYLVSHWRSFKQITPEKKAMFFFVIACIFSILANASLYKSEEIFVASLYLFRWIAYASLFFVVLDFSQKLRSLIPYFMLVSGFLIVIAGFVQYFLYPSLRNLYYLGWDEHLYRMFSTFLDPNFAGSFFVLYAIFIFNQLLKADKKLKWIFLVISILTIGAVFLTFSRSAILMFFVSSFIYFSARISQKVAFVVLALFILIPFFFTKLPQSEGTNFFRTASSTSKIHSQQNAIKIIIDHPVFGIGFNAYRYAQKQYGFITKESAFPDHSGAGTDNSYLFVLATSGIIGFLAYASLWRLFFLRYKHDALVIASLGGLFVNAFFLNSLFYPMIMAWLWILFGFRDNT